MRPSDGFAAIPHGHDTARERAYQTLKLRLITLDLAPGAALDLPRLMRELSIGRTPLSEAIQRLASEDLLTIHPRRGTVVTQPSFSQARHILEVRDMLEARAARLAAQRCSRDELQALRGLVDQQLHERDEGDYAHFLLHDYRLHLMVAAISGNPLLVRSLDHLLALNMRLWFVFFKIQGPQARYLFSHEPIFHAIERRDPDAAEAAALAHVRECNDVLFTLFQTTPDQSQRMANVGGVVDAGAAQGREEDGREREPEHGPMALTTRQSG